LKAKVLDSNLEGGKYVFEKDLFVKDIDEFTGISLMFAIVLIAQHFSQKKVTNIRLNEF
jgi:hypothetical protein